MKRIYLSIVFVAIVIVSVFAAKSTGKVHAVAQPDGTTLMIRLLGDEHFSWYQTPDGVLIDWENNGYYIAKTESDGTLSSSGILAHNPDNRGTQELQAIQMQNKDLFFSSLDNAVASQMKKIISGYPSSSYCPHNGTVRVPIILMNYTDTILVTEPSVWEEYFNGTEYTPYTKATKYDGYGSVASYFAEASNGNLNFVFDIYGPYTADNGHHYYGRKQGSSYGFELLKEAVKKADADIDFTEYDSNDDGRVDMVYIVYAGTGANLSGDKNDVWPACWYGQYVNTEDGKIINVIGESNELALSAAQHSGTPLRAGIGVLCHEMSHGLGLPDLYWTASTKPTDADGNRDYNNCGPEDWDLMDGGENVYNGMWPCQYTAWEREIMGWLPVEELTEPTDVTIYPLDTDEGKAYRVTNPANQNEYYVIENYTSDAWNYYVNYKYGTGLMITHVNATDYGLSMAPNNNYGKPNVTILPADGFILASYSVNDTCMYQGTLQKITKDMYYADLQGDPYVGTKSTSQVTELAAYKNYAGEEMVTKYPITDITRNEDGSISFKFMWGSSAGIDAVCTDEKDKINYNIQGQKVGAGYRGIVIRGGKKYSSNPQPYD